MDYNNYNYNISHNELDPHVKMAQTALTLGLISIPLCLFPYVGIPMACVAILLAILSKGNYQKLLPQAKKSVFYSIVGIVLGYALIAHSFVTVFTNPEARDYLNQTYERMYGISFDDALKELGVPTDN